MPRGPNRVSTYLWRNIGADKEPEEQPGSRAARARLVDGQKDLSTETNDIEGQPHLDKQNESEDLIGTGGR